MGGYFTLDGSRTKWGTFYGSDPLRDVTDLDLEYIEQLDLYSIIDFRSEWERKEAPDRLSQQHEIKTLALPITPNNSSEAFQEISERVSKGDIKGLDAMELITGDYRRFVIRHTPIPPILPGIIRGS
jgi:protein-tyrosine phosphatase